MPKDHQQLLELAEPLVQTIHRFWFGTLDSEQCPEKEYQDQWFGKNEEFDKRVRSQFGTYLETAVMGALDRWVKNDAGAIALIILLDQFPRNIFRGSPKSYAYDHKAMATADPLIRQEAFLRVPPCWGYFMLMPAMHCENLDVQDLSVASFARLREASSGPAKAMIESAYSYAVKHREVVARFGRFPHRNAILGRSGTTEEIAYLAAGGPTF